MAALLCGGLGLPLCPVTRTISTTTTALASSSSQSSSRIITTTSLSSVSFGTPSFSNTFSTSFVASASLIASSIQTSSISSSFGLSPTSILTIRTTSTSTTPNSSQIPSSTTAASPVPTGPTCPAADGQSFTAQDGSQYLIVCNQGYSSNSQNVFGLIPVAVNSYLDCLNLCSNQGSICAGITYGYFGSDTLQCNLKTKMLRDNQPSGYNVDSALRMSGPTVSGNRSQLVTNGDFMENMGSLSPWTTDTFSIEGMSGVPTSYWVLADSFGYKAGELIQAVNISAGLSYYMTVSLSFSTSGPISPNNFCNFYAQTDYEILFFFNPNLTSFTSAFSSNFNASGTTTRDASRFILFMYCSGNFNITWAIDSVAFYTYLPSLGTNPLVPPPSTSILRDGNFTSGLQYWRWRPNPNLNNNVLSPSSIATVLLPPGTLNNVTALMNYMMPSSLVPSTPGLTPQRQQQQQQQQQRLTVITFSTLSPMTTTFTSGYPTQIAPLPISLNQTFRLTGTVYFNVSSSCSCDAGIYNTLYQNSGVNAWAWSVFGVRERRVVEVNVTGMATAGNAEFQVYVGCEGTDAGCGVGVGGLAMRVNV